MSNRINPQDCQILIIDDEQGIRDVLVFALSKNGYRAQAASSAEDALNKIRNDSFNLVICDLKMQGADGLELLQSFKTYTSDLEMIIITGAPDLQTTIQALRMGVFDYIPKPFDLEQIYESVERALEHQQQNRALVHAEELGRLQSELVLNMSDEFKTITQRVLVNVHKIPRVLGQNGARGVIEQLERDTTILLQLVSNIHDLPQKSAGHLYNARLEWHDLIQRLSRFDKSKAKAHILVVDDDQVIVELLQYLLAKEGYTVENAGDGHEALAALRRRRPDFLLLDLMMPKLNGFELLEAIAKIPELKNLPIFVLTARNLSSRERMELQKRVSWIIQKGETDIHQIVAVLNQRAYSIRPFSLT